MNKQPNMLFNCKITVNTECKDNIQTNETVTAICDILPDSLTCHISPADDKYNIDTLV